MSTSTPGLASGSTPLVGPSRGPDSKPKKPQLTHFLCIPLHNATPQLTLSLEALQNDLVINEELVSASAIRPAVTMHLTLGVMSLTSSTLIQRAKNFVETGLDITQLLQSLNPSTEVEPFTIDLRGLDAMGQRRRTSVLYAVPCDSTGRLRVFAEAVKAAFEEEGLMVKEDRELKLHATVVNTIYSKGGQGRGRGGGGGRGRGRGDGRGQRECFDAEDVVDKYRDVAFADGVRLDKVAVCRMGEVRAEDGTSQGYLVCGERTF